MGFDIGSGKGTAPKQGDLVPAGLAVAQLVHCELQESKVYDSTNFKWFVELFADGGENPEIIIWTNKTLHPSYAMYHMVKAIQKEEPTITNTDLLLGLPFQIMVVHHDIDGEDGEVVTVNRAMKAPGYTFLPFEGDDPFEPFVPRAEEVEDPVPF